MLANQIQPPVKRIIHHDQVWFIPSMQGWFNIQKPINVIHHTSRIKDKTHIILLIETEKAFDNSPKQFVVKTLNKIEMEGNFLNFVKQASAKTHSQRYS